MTFRRPPEDTRRRHDRTDPNPTEQPAAARHSPSRKKRTHRPAHSVQGPQAPCTASPRSRSCKFLHRIRRSRKPSQRPRAAASSQNCSLWTTVPASRHTGTKPIPCARRGSKHREPIGAWRPARRHVPLRAAGTRSQCARAKPRQNGAPGFTCLGP